MMAFITTLFLLFSIEGSKQNLSEVGQLLILEHNLRAKPK